MSPVEVRRLPDGSLQARRVDGKPLTDADRNEVRRIAQNNAEPIAVDHPESDPFRDPDIIAHMVENDEVIAVLIHSAVLNAKIWFALNENWRPEPGVKTPVFYGSELAALRDKSPEQLKEIYRQKCVWPHGGKVRS